MNEKFSIYKTFAKDANQKVKRTRASRENVERLEEAVQSFNERRKKGQKKVTGHIWYSSYDSDRSLKVGLNLDTGDMKDVTRVLRHLARNGFHQRPSERKMYEDTEGHYQKYFLFLKSDSKEKTLHFIEMVFNFNTGGEGATCEYVEVSRRTEIVPEYKMLCGEELKMHRAARIRA